MAKGHAGPHIVGDPYRPTERWVTPCQDGKCEYHENSNRLQKTVWLECIHCGHQKPLEKHPRCHHIWFPKGEPVVAEITTTHIHECPKCGKVKKTIRRHHKLPPDIKWPREIEKILEKAKAEGLTLLIDGNPIDHTKITVLELK